MLDRKSVEEALYSPDWQAAFGKLVDLSNAQGDEGEKWRTQAMAECACVVSSGAVGRDAAAQLRELVRLSDGHMRVPGALLQPFANSLLT